MTWKTDPGAIILESGAFLSQWKRFIQQSALWFIPAISKHRLELDRAHIALQPIRTAGLPWDIIIKPHFYAIKEEVMKVSRNSERLTIQGHQIQNFADLYPYTVQKWCFLKKPCFKSWHKKKLLTDGLSLFGWTSLTAARPLDFHHLCKRLLLHLELITQEIPLPFAIRGSLSTRKLSPPSPLTPVWQKQQGGQKTQILPDADTQAEEKGVLFCILWNWTLGSYSPFRFYYNLPITLLPR